jgi:hypothetical protein
VEVALGHPLHVRHGDCAELLQPGGEPVCAGDDLAEAQPVRLIGDAFAAVGELGLGLLDGFLQLGLGAPFLLHPFDLGPDGLLHLLMGGVGAEGDTEGEEVGAEYTG